MKKFLQKLAVGVFALYSFSAQSQNFFETVTFAGALSHDPAMDWTAGWTEWDPQNKAYPAVTDTITINALQNNNAQSIGGTRVLSITSDLTLDASKVYKLSGFVVVAPGAKLTIPAGTVIRGEGTGAATGNYASIVVRPGAQIFINGTKSNPVVMTSNKPVGQRGVKNLSGKVLGDWGGLVICGAAEFNQAAGTSLEGFSDAGVTSLGTYGGSNNDDNSGVIRYLRIEFAGLDFATNKELNSLTMGAVGRQTVVDYVQCSMGGDDAFEWFGGTVNCKHLIAYATADDDFDTDFGYSGGVQFGIGVKDSSRFDITWNQGGGSTSEGFESDNDNGGTQASPRTSAVFSNMTMMGPIPSGIDYSAMSSRAQGAFRRGARIRRNSAISIVNSIFTGYRNVLMYDGSASLTAAGVTIANPTATSTSQFLNNILWKSDIATSTTNNGFVETSSASQLSALNSWLTSLTTLAGTTKLESNTTSNWAKGNLFENPTVGASFNPRPKSAALVANVASFSNVSRLSAVVVSSVAGTGVTTFPGTFIIQNEGEFVEGSSFIYPNPTEGASYLSFSSLAGSSATIVVYDLAGSEVKRFNTYINSGDNKIMIDGLEAGSYIVKLGTAKGSALSFKLLKL